jgi:hypothetical protein
VQVETVVSEKNLKNQSNLLGYPVTGKGFKMIHSDKRVSSLSTVESDRRSEEEERKTNEEKKSEEEAQGSTSVQADQRTSFCEPILCLMLPPPIVDDHGRSPMMTRQACIDWSPRLRRPPPPPPTPPQPPPTPQPPSHSARAQCTSPDNLAHDSYRIICCLELANPSHTAAAASRHFKTTFTAQLKHADHVLTFLLLRHLLVVQGFPPRARASAAPFYPHP